MIKGKDYPEWMKEESLKILQRRYLLDGETPSDMWWRCAKAAASRLRRPNMARRFYEAMWNGWLGLATPVACNLGTERGLPISCFLVDVEDSMWGIGRAQTELMMLTKFGGGVGISLNRVRGRNTPIGGGIGVSEGVVPWAKIYDSTIVASNQGSVRRGAASVNLNLDHIDAEEFLRIRRPSGEVSRQCLNIHHCVQVTDNFMQRIEDGDPKARKLWTEVVRARVETGEPYIHFIDHTNRANPKGYQERNLEVSMTNICSEIMLHTDPSHTAVCCLSSLNVAKYDEWPDDLPQTAAWFLEGVMEEFINRAKFLKGFENAVSSAEKGRPIGIGMMGFHTYLQSKGISLSSPEALRFSAKLSKDIKDKAYSASRRMAEAYGEPEYCKGTGMRHSHMIAIAPTGSNSRITGYVSPCIEPITANAYVDRTAKGAFMVRNDNLIPVLEKYGKNDDKTWKSITKNGGSVAHLDFLSDEEKDLFKTAREINQKVLVRLAAARQPFIDQGQSLNLFFPKNVSPKFLNEVHLLAWQLELKTLYYCRSAAEISADAASRYYEEPDCESCEG